MPDFQINNCPCGDNNSGDTEEILLVSENAE